MAGKVDEIGGWDSKITFRSDGSINTTACSHVLANNVEALKGLELKFDLVDDGSRTAPF